MPKYDLVVIGAGIGGLATAALASRLKKKVLVLEPGSSVGGVVAARESKGNFFYPGPALSFGFDRGGSLQRLHDALGITQKAALRSLCYQVALPGSRVTVYAEPSETLEELKREFPREIDAIAGFYRDLGRKAARNSKSRSAAFLSRHRKVEAYLRSRRFSPAFMAFLDVQSRYFFRMPAPELSLTALITLLDSAPLSVDRGFSLLAEEMLGVILSNGGEIRYRVPADRIALEPQGLLLADGRVDATCILLNTEQQRNAQTVLVALRSQAVPVGMLQTVLCVPGNAGTANSFFVSLSEPDEQATPSGDVSALVATFTGERKTLEERITQLADLIPFLRDFCVHSEEILPEARSVTLPEHIVFKTIRTPDRAQLLHRSWLKGLYLLPDGAGTPLQSVAAAQHFVDSFL